MTIKSLTIKNYQSHTHSHFELGNLTVLVGPSSSGKSSVVRAISALASNESGKDFITHGEQTAQISVTTDKGTLVLTKGKPEDSYVILENGSTEPRKYTKNGVGVPEDVTRFLGIAPKDAINFAGQFDMPYLLKTSAPEVARVLGELTNVSSIFEASREALRRKNSYSATLKTREGDYERLVPAMDRFENLAVQSSALTTAEMYYNAAVAVQGQLDRLNDLLLTLQTATARLKAASSATSAPLPDVQTAIDLYARLTALDALINDVRAATGRENIAAASRDAQSTLMEELEIEYDTALQEAMTCPTCGQSTKGIHAHV